MPLISMIMPVYNSEKYVAAAIDSILSQDFEDFELLLVDDGSKDNSGIICDGYATKDARIKVFHIPNGGMCHARNFAIKKAMGDYIGFADNDDNVLPGLFSRINQIYQETPYTLDAFCFGRYAYRYSPEGVLTRKIEAKPKETKSYSQFNTEAFLTWNYSDGVWCRMYRREFLIQNSIQFDESLKHGAEDILFNCAVAKYIKSAAFISESFYIWMSRSTHSTSMSSISNDTLEGLKKGLAEKEGLIKQYSLETDKQFETNYFFGAFIFHVLQLRYKERPSYKNELPLYVGLSDLYEPHVHHITANCLPVPERLAWIFFTNKRYRLLYALICCSRIIK